MGKLLSILVLEWMLFDLVRLVNVDIDVLSDVLNVVKLNWLLPILTLLVVLLIVLDIIHHVLIFIEGEVLLITLEVSCLSSQMWVGKRFLLRYRGQVFFLL